MGNSVGARMMICMCMLLAYCTGCALDVPDTTAAPHPTASPMKTPTEEHTATRIPMNDTQIEQLLSEGLQGDLISFEPDRQTGEEIIVHFQILLEETASRTIRTARDDTVCILHSIAGSGISYEKIIVSGWAPITIDINSNTQNTELLFLQYDRETVDAINWDTLRAQYIWLIASYSQIHDSLQD